MISPPPLLKQALGPESFLVFRRFPARATHKGSSRLLALLPPPGAGAGAHGNDCVLVLSPVLHDGVEVLLLEHLDVAECRRHDGGSAPGLPGSGVNVGTEGKSDRIMPVTH